MDKHVPAETHKLIPHDDPRWTQDPYRPPNERCVLDATGARANGDTCLHGIPWDEHCEECQAYDA